MYVSQNGGKFHFFAVSFILWMLLVNSLNNPHHNLSVVLPYWQVSLLPSHCVITFRFQAYVTKAGTPTGVSVLTRWGVRTVVKILTILTSYQPITLTYCWTKVSLRSYCHGITVWPSGQGQEMLYLCGSKLEKFSLKLRFVNFFFCFFFGLFLMKYPEICFSKNKIESCNLSSGIEIAGCSNLIVFFYYCGFLARYVYWNITGRSNLRLVFFFFFFFVLLFFFWILFVCLFI